MITDALSNTTSLIVVGLFLFITLFIGLYTSRGVKNFKDYVQGGKRFTTSTMILTFLATNIGGGSIFGDVEDTYSDGIIVIITLLGFSINLLFRAYFIAPKIVKFTKELTLGDLMYSFYGKFGQILSGVIGTIHAICLIVMQLIAIKKISYFLGINIEFLLITVGICMIIYSTIGGIRSVIKTDVIHFLIIIIVIPLISWIVMGKLGGIKNILTQLPKEKIEIFHHSKFGYYLTMLIVWCIFPFGIPIFIQILFLSKDPKKIKNQFLIISFFDPLFRIIIGIIACVGILTFKNSQPSDVLPLMIDKFLPPNLKILTVIGLLSAIMSTADSYLYSSGISLIHDTIVPIFGPQKRELLITKISTAILGIISIIISLKFNNIVSVGFFAAGLLFPIISIPIVSGIMGLKTDKMSFKIATIATILTYVYCKLNIKPGYLTPLISIIVNFIFFYGSHIIQNRGIAIINRDYDEEKPQRIWKPRWSNFIKALDCIIPTPKKIFELSRKSVVNYGANNVLFGIFVCINFIVLHFMWGHENENIYNLMIYLRLFGSILGGLLIVRSEWSDFLKPYFPLFWHFSLLYCLPFISTVMFLLSNGSIFWLLNIGTSIFFLIMLTENAIFLILTPIGIILGIIFYIFKVGPIDLSGFGFEVNYQLIYQLVFSSIIGLFFSYRKKIFNAIKGNEGTNLGLAICHELRNTGLYIYPAAQISLKYLNKYKNSLKKMGDQRGYFINEKDFVNLDEQSLKIEKLGKLQNNIVATFEKLLKEYRDSINDPQNFSMKHLIKETLTQFIFKEGQREMLVINLKDDFITKVPKRVFIFVIDNIIRNAYKHGNPSKIKIWLEDNELHIKDNGKGIPESQINQIFKMHFTTGDETSFGIGLAFAKQIIEGFGGEIWVESEQGKDSYTEFIIKFPKVWENLSKEEIQENIQMETKKKIAISMKENDADEALIKKITGFSLDDL